MNPTTEERTIVKLERTIAAPPERVYRAWLDPDLLSRWLAPGAYDLTRAEVDERVGGSYRIWHGLDGEQTGGVEAELLELVPDRRLAFRWGFVGPDRTAGPVFDTLLTVTFEPAADGATRLTLVHERLEGLREAMPYVYENIAGGWGSVLDQLPDALRDSA
jgi:uncharacterized protein YndB with AHSA1/START domain